MVFWKSKLCLPFGDVFHLNKIETMWVKKWVKIYFPNLETPSYETLEKESIL